MKKKLRDCSEKELNEYCWEANDCSGCKLNVPNNGCTCLRYVDKTYLSNKALNIELDIPVKEILDKADKETLIYHCLLLKRENCKIGVIVKESSLDSDFVYIKFYFCNKSDRNEDYLCLPLFNLKDTTMFANMELGKEYAPQDL